ncbi:uncharacterized protein N7496_009728 [Penicillium cataractarum]|uniref:Zn(2)-C6 fungal-type domain-containing protein n=1 Tax=Penicillium cataractarum TaxID=2100454 RepID=A0A9W9V2E8_9EURO|nr:uncharacterized protein N7496_009728 [Penicillium cataractarum]KAJ5364015.1 hypothetical protein N7496_009728 [Penicillium cataractarum]
MEISPSRKRPRPVISCLRCREKKLKCDRAAPCQNCWKAGCRAECAYNQHPQSTESLPKAKRVQLSTERDGDDQQPHSRPGTGIIEDLQQRVVKLEELLAVRPHAGNFGPIRDAPVQSSWPQSDSTLSTAPFLGTLVVKGSRTRYHGQNNRVTLLNQFPDAKAFINHCSEDSALVGLAKEVQFLQTKSLAPITSPQSLSGLESFPELQHLLSSLPPKSTCDKLLEVYTTNCEKTLRVIHVPSFLRQYTSFWQDSDHQSASSFVPLLTAVLTVAVSFDPQPSTLDESTSWDYLTKDATKSLQVWLAKLPRKQRVGLATLQVETLLLISQQLRLVSPEELWKASGSLVRSGMVMGLHVNLSQSTNLSFYQAECRRRLWITIIELDLQASITSGMPVMTPELDFGPLTPLNIHDVDFDEPTSKPPSPSPLSGETDSLAQITLATSLAHRIRVMKTVQHTNPHDNLGERVKQGLRLEKYISDVPTQLKPNHNTESARPAFVLNQVLLDIFLRRPLLCLFRPVITHISHDDPSFHEIRGACLDSSLAILSYQDHFDPQFADLDLSNSTPYWDIFHMLCQHDILWAALSVCEHMRLPMKTPTASSPANDVTESRISRIPTPSKAGLTRMIENTIDSFTRRIHNKGNNVKDLILLTVVLQSVRARGSEEQKERSMLQGAKNTLTACRQQLLSMTTQPSLSSDMPDLAQMVQSSETLTQLQDTGQRLSTSQPQIPDTMQLPSQTTAEFENFVDDLFAFDDGSFMWNI